MYIKLICITSVIKNKEKDAYGKRQLAYEKSGLDAKNVRTGQPKQFHFCGQRHFIISSHTANQSQHPNSNPGLADPKA